MKYQTFRIFTRPGAFLQLTALLTLTPLLPLPEADALAPQDSTHLGWEFPRLDDEGTQSSPWVANGKVYYYPVASGGIFSGKLRARDFAGGLVFDYSNPKMDPTCSISADGRIYFMEALSGTSRRIVILAPDGTKLGDFGPEGLVAGGTFSRLDTIAVSPVSDKVYVTDQFLPNSSTIDPAKKCLVRVFDKDGNYLHQFNTSGILASTLEGPVHHLLIRADKEGKDELLVFDHYDGIKFNVAYKGNLKIFGEDGGFRRLVTGGIFDPQLDSHGQTGNGTRLRTGFLWKELFVCSAYGNVQIFPAAVSNGSQLLALLPLSTVIGFNDSGEIILSANGKIYTHSYPNYATFDSLRRNAVPNPWVLNIEQRPGTGIVDIDYRVDDTDDDSLTTALVAFAGGTASLSNVLPINTLLEGTAIRVGANQPTGAVQRVTWDAGTDWNVDFGTLRVMALARDSRSHWFDVHLVEIPADGVRPAVTISRVPLRQDDFLAQFLWLVAKKDSSVELIDGVLFGTTGEDDGVILANGSTPTAAGRTFLLKRDGLRIATAAEITRAREGATPGFEVTLDPPLQMHRNHPAGSFPNKINEFGVESGSIGTAWYVVRESAE